MATSAEREANPVNAEEISPAVNAILGANPFVGLDVGQILNTIGEFVSSTMGRPEKIASRLSQFGLELLKIGAGTSDVQADPGDKRFSDPTWTENPIYHRVMQSYLAWRSAMLDLAGGVPQENSNGDWKHAAQQRFAVTLLTEALAPTNTLPGNPAALKRAFETGGNSLVAGLRNFVDDLLNNGGMPSQVDKRPFEVGKTIAVTPGAVVHRNELCEVLQYAPATRQVYERPLLLIPPQINKYYVMDLAPKRSLTEYAVANGIQIFNVSWRNAGPEHRNWGFDECVGACNEVLEVVCNITGSPDANLLGVCAGGITSSLLLGHLAAIEDRRVHAGTLLVTMLDSSEHSLTGMFTTEEGVRAAIQRSQQKGVLDAASLQRTFAWLRPNDLVWHYWVNNYLMGKEPAPFDILYWNADSTNLPAKLHADFLELLLHNPLVAGTGPEILGTSVKLRDFTGDMYVVGGQTDHIVAWRACYRAARLFGGRTEFVLNSSGHVQTLVCPPGNPKAKFFSTPHIGDDADVWLKGANEHKGSWWDHWLGWLEKRSGEKHAAPETLGSRRFRPIEPAPGTYVHQKP
jgi:polyhydroxyalkanoate synthase